MKLFLPTSFIVISIILFILVINPRYKEISNLRTDVSLYNEALTNSTNLQKTQDALIEKYKNIKQEDRDRLDHFLPNTINNIKFILEVEKVASLHGLQIKDIKFQTEEKAVSTDEKNKNISLSSSKEVNLPYGIFPLEFSVSSDYDTFNSFLRDLELNLRLVDVKSIGFSVPEKSTDKTNPTNPNIYNYSLKVQTYWLK
jgi:hypothetical protein